ncbi:MAG: asparagine synthase (glutamine-hydrolyzing) [Planctomycetota bacterium]|nr:MAG: asparagine synthase (glutamine-hydrolyzing) [Planctomycetota bacterium]
MCGIAGFNWEDKDKIRQLADLLSHRGPEQQGYHVADGISLGHKRLCILDLSEKGTQPIYNEDGSVCIVYNGETYNFAELRKELETFGRRFVSKTDTEVVLHGYEQWGTDVLKKMNGQFALCIHDKNQNRLILARDRLGIKPLYYYNKDGRFIFGSELKVLLKSDIEKTIDSRSLNHYMLFGYVPSGCSILQDVKQLPPAHYLVFDLNENRIQCRERFWRLQYDKSSEVADDEMVLRIRELLDTSVRRRLISDVPLGAFLSGGVDSSILVAIMRKYVKELRTFSIKFDYADFNESSWAQIVSQKFDTIHHEIAFNAGDVCDLIPNLVHFYDEPFADYSMIPTYLVSKVARDYVTVSLSGAGGDELFGGYPRYTEFPILKKLNHMPFALKRAADLAIRTTNLLLKNDKLNKLRCFLADPLDDTYLYLMLFSYMFRDTGEQVSRLDEFSEFSRYFCHGDDMTNLMCFDLNEYLPADLFTKEDRASMAVSLETRVPFLDHELVEYAATLPTTAKIRNREKKYILKKAYENDLPKEILQRKKQGFGVPLVHYFRDELKDFAYRTIFEFDEYEYYDKSEIRKYWDRHQAKRSDYSRIFWTIIMFNLWHREWLK